MTLRIYYQFLAFNMSIRLKEGQERKSKEYKKAKGKEKQNQIYNISWKRDYNYILDN